MILTHFLQARTKWQKKERLQICRVSHDFALKARDKAAKKAKAADFRTMSMPLSRQRRRDQKAKRWLGAFRGKRVQGALA